MKKLLFFTTIISIVSALSCMQDQRSTEQEFESKWYIDKELELNNRYARAHTAVSNNDDTALLVAATDNKAHIIGYDNSVRASFSHESPVLSARWNSDEQEIATITENKACVWDSNTQQSIQELPLVKGRSVRWRNKNDKLILVAAQNNAFIWDLNSNEPVILFPHDKSVRCAEWSNDHSHVLTASIDGLAHVWHSTVSLSSITLHHRSPIYCATWNPKNTLIATGTKDSSVRMWNAYNGELKSLIAHDSPVTSLCWNAYNDDLVTITQKGVVCIWHTLSNELPTILPTYNWPQGSCSWNNDGTSLITTPNLAKLYVWKRVQREV